MVNMFGSSLNFQPLLKAGREILVDSGNEISGIVTPLLLRPHSAAYTTKCLLYQIIIPK
jgi:hypothetical protein